MPPSKYSKRKFQEYSSLKYTRIHTYTLIYVWLHLSKGGNKI